MKKNIKPKKIKKGDGNNSLFDLAVGISMGDENHELEKRIQTITEELKKKDEIIENLSKGGGGLEVLQKLKTLQEENSNLQQIIEKFKSSKGNTYLNTTEDNKFIKNTLERITTLQKENDILRESIKNLVEKLNKSNDIRPVILENIPKLKLGDIPNDTNFQHKIPNIQYNIPISSRKEKQRVPIS